MGCFDGLFNAPLTEERIQIAAGVFCECECIYNIVCDTKRVGLSDGRGIKQIHIKKLWERFPGRALGQRRAAASWALAAKALSHAAIKCGSFGGGKSSVNDCS